MLLGVDVSEYQGRPQWGRVASGGVVFAFARVSYGAAHPDTSYAWNRVGIPDAGIVPGAYHFLTPGSDAARQADVFAGLADPAAVHALDVERAAVDVEGWVARYRRHHPDKPLLIYTGRDLWRAGAGDVNGARIGPLWLAGVVPNGYVPGSGSLAGLAAEVGDADGDLPWGGWTSPTIIQITDKARVPGIDGPVDGDLLRGTLDDLRALQGGDVMPLTEAEWIRLGALIDGKLAAARAGIADEVETRYQVHVGNHLETVTAVLGEVLGAVTGLTPDAVAAAVRKAFPAGPGSTIDPAALASAVLEQLDLRPQIRDVLLHGAGAGQ